MNKNSSMKENGSYNLTKISLDFFSVSTLSKSSRYGILLQSQPQQYGSTGTYEKFHSFNGYQFMKKVFPIN